MKASGIQRARASAIEESKRVQIDALKKESETCRRLEVIRDAQSQEAHTLYYEAHREEEEPLLQLTNINDRNLESTRQTLRTIEEDLTELREDLEDLVEKHRSEAEEREGGLRQLKEAAEKIRVEKASKVCQEQTP